MGAARALSAATLPRQGQLRPLKSPTTSLGKGWLPVRSHPPTRSRLDIHGEKGLVGLKFHCHPCPDEAGIIDGLDGDGVAVGKVDEEKSEEDGATKASSAATLC
ncbi:hypothetical protein CRG98_032285 [Punica granatum]|uniref:Uncharacterized protein n=1 Tax=Punica granatum TaxID=22663 RepID=A0A2I0IUH5_PUNGR|nr:hypothetical protein CRG98_032285 [Punica granatum]